MISILWTITVPPDDQTTITAATGWRLGTLFLAHKRLAGKFRYFFNTRSVHIFEERFKYPIGRESKPLKSAQNHPPSRLKGFDEIHQDRR
jgi:hypothetical protein